MRIALATFLLALALQAVAGPSADAVTGVWLTAEGDGYIQIFRRDGAYHGRAVGAPPDSGRAEAEDDRKLLGKRILEGFVHDGEGRWVNGTAYDPDEDKTYSAKLWLEDADTLKLRGFVGISLFGRTETWTRAEPDAKGVATDALIQPGDGESAASNP